MIAEQSTTSQGVLELHPKGFGFLRNPARHYSPQAADPYVPGLDDDAPEGDLSDDVDSEYVDDEEADPEADPDAGERISVDPEDIRRELAELRM